jgi:bifunctional DNA-binding transcriptional regulator/antitoxin component of YhaV-PrlF toxin-antitoxin module
MSILTDTPGLLDALRGEMTPKFLASRNPAGIPNVVPVISILPVDDQEDTLFFGNFLLRKTVQNLDQDKRVGILVITADLKGWILSGDFIEWQRTGKYVEQQMSSPLLRYNAYTGVRNAGLIRVRTLLGGFSIPKLKVALDYLTIKLFAATPQGKVDSAVTIPLEVRRQFGLMTAIKVLAWVDRDGYPRILPMLSLQPRGENFLAGRVEPYNLTLPEDGAPVAANILTLEAVSYQAKGQWAKQGNLGAIAVQEIYAGGPPKPGGRLA